jgi:hypothetical protein
MQEKSESSVLIHYHRNCSVGLSKTNVRERQSGQALNRLGFEQGTHTATVTHSCSLREDHVT